MANKRTTTSRDIVERSFAFAVRTLKMVRAMPRDLAGSALAKQVVRSGTSIGANIEEAQGASSKKEFARRMNIARAEARETLYWLRLISVTGLLPQPRLREIITEADELVSILTTIVKRAKADGPTSTAS